VSQESISKMEEDLCFANRFEISSTLNSSFTVGILGFLPTTVVSSMSAGSFKNISELRTVTTMFLKLDSYSPEKNADLASLQPFFYMAQEAIFLSGGVLRQFLVDDKGCVLIALWGVPSASYANNASRALVCATTISDKARAMNHATSIGITTGPCFCGTIGSILRRDYVAIGDSVNMAARLMSKAQGRTFVDDNSYSSLASSLRDRLREGEPLNLKGRSLPLTPYIFICSHSANEADGGSVTTTESVVNLSLLSINSSTGSHQFTTQITSISSDDSVFMTLPHRKGKTFSKHHPHHMSHADDSAHDNSLVHGEQFDNQSSELELRSNLNPHIEKTLNDHIKHLVNLQRNIMRKHQTNPKSATSGHSSGQTPTVSSPFKCQLMSSQPFPLMKYVVVHGKQGSGKTEVAKFFRKLSLQHKVRCFYVRAVEEDVMLEYGVFRRLFYALIGSNVVRTSSEEQHCILSLLKITYPQLTDKILMKTKFPVVKDILGLEWDVEIANGSLVGVPEKKMITISNPFSKQCYFMKYKSNTIMSELIRSLLMNIPSTIIIDDAHFCDTLTWREMSYLTSADLPLVSLFTMRPPLRTVNELQELIEQDTRTHDDLTSVTPQPQQAMSKYGSLIRRFFRKENRVHPNNSLAENTGQEQTLRKLAAEKYTPTTPAASVCQHLATNNPHGTLLTLGHLTRTQISNILCCALARSEVLPELIEIVQEVSAGNAYWVRLIADYVSQFGYESFMKSVGVTDTEDLEKEKTHDSAIISTEVKAIPVTNPNSSSGVPVPNGNYAITSSFRQYGSLHVVDKATRKEVRNKKMNNKTTQEHESNHLRIFIVSLVDQLSISDTSILKLASVIGVTFCSMVLRQVLPQNLQKPGLLESCLMSLESKGFIIRVSAEGTFYLFQNHRFREIIYDFTPPRSPSSPPPLRFTTSCFPHSVAVM
jgi:hypothetical protein